jgi:hypothetical protein
LAEHWHANYIAAMAPASTSGSANPPTARGFAAPVSFGIVVEVTVVLRLDIVVGLVLEISELELEVGEEAGTEEKPVNE